MSTFSGANPGDARNGIFAAAALFLSCVWVTISLRIWVRVTIIRSLGWDDATLIFAADQIIFTGYCVVEIMIETVGGAPHAQNLGLSELSRLVALTVASFDLYITAMVFLKISLGIFYLRFVIRTWEKYAVYSTIIISTAYGVFLFFIALLNCGNPSKYLENELKGICMPNNAIYPIQLAGALVNACTDWVLAIMPIYILVKGTMPLRVKISAGVVLLLGCTGSVISLVRIQYMKGLLPGPNFFNTSIDLCIWSIIECGLGISAAAAATLRPLFRSLREHTNGYMSYGRSRSAMGSVNQTRFTDTMFGDWGFEPPQHEQELRASRSRSHISITPILKNSRVMSKMGITRETIAEQGSQLMSSPVATANQPTRQKSRRLQSRLSRIEHTTQPQRPEMVRQLSVREKGISRPVPHIFSQAAPPTPTGEHQQELIRIDHRRNGSPNWVPKTKRTPDRSSNPYFDSPNPYRYSTPTSPYEGRPF
ncbi:hypothetical protein M409DRAFT_53484 [Zasmidium cellare ATCC 36951]|uniref:Rhodopsin domain-containing protein n=1 Tax=Zasmidium cellare ATCC 36951 TaxID=1080233 RepID=A0A6A6CMB0_ZASCE|nr:uncharacterized protein M409DRAFT_53484 [Zasmidium cellare ATCC 36951]KAF2168181.1 hypothetical protein M409DRAFT_53484 [Zasmidium cellare ATCC 36951]